MGLHQPINMASGDRNENEARKGAKLMHKNFSLALKKLPADHEVHSILKVLPRKKKAEFYQNWSKDPTWGFVRIFKTTSTALIDHDQTRTLWKSRQWLVRELGKSGALRHMACMEEQNRYKLHETSGLKLYEYSEESQSSSLEKRREKKSEVVAEEEIPRGSEPEPPALMALTNGSPEAASPMLLGAPPAAPLAAPPAPVASPPANMASPPASPPATPVAPQPLAVAPPPHTAAFLATIANIAPAPAQAAPPPANFLAPPVTPPASGVLLAPHTEQEVVIDGSNASPTTAASSAEKDEDVSLGAVAEKDEKHEPGNNASKKRTRTSTIKVLKKHVGSDVMDTILKLDMPLLKRLRSLLEAITDDKEE